MSAADMGEHPTHRRIGLARRDVSIRLRFRWESAPATCAALIGLLPLHRQVWHAKHANNEGYVLVRTPEPPPRRENPTVFPSRGDLVFLPLPEGIPVPSGLPGIDSNDPVLDIAYFYESGSNLLAGPLGPLAGTIVATAETLDDIDAMAAACRDVWFSGTQAEAQFLPVE